MKKRFLVGRGLLAAAITVGGGAALAFWAAAPASASGTPQISVVASHSGTGLPTPGHPKVASASALSPGYVAHGSTGNTAVLVYATGAAHVYLIAGASGPNEYHIATGTSGPTLVYGTLVAGDAYAVAGNGTIGITSRPGAGTTVTTGESPHIGAVTNAIAPVSLAFDASGNLLIGEAKPNTGPTKTAIQMVAKAACSGTCHYGYGSQVAGGLYSLTGTGALSGITATPAIVTTNGVYGYSIGATSGYTLISGASGAIYYFNFGSAVTKYGHTLPAHAASVVAGTATIPGAACASGGTTAPAIGASAPKFQQPEAVLDAAGDIYVNDNRITSGKGCDWVVPAQSGTLDNMTVHAGTAYSLTGPANATAYTSGAVAKTTSFGGTQSLALDLAGNIVVTQSGTTPVVKVIAEHSTTFYGQSMTAGHVYNIAGGATGTRTTPVAGAAKTFRFAGSPRSAHIPVFGLTSITTGAAGDLLLTNGSTASTGNLYQITGAPSGPPTPIITSVTPGSGHQAGNITVTVHGTNLTGASSVTFGGVAATDLHTNTATKVIVKNPAGTGKVAVKVVATLGTYTKATAFTYTAPTATHVTLTVAGTRYAGTKVKLTAHVTPSTAAGTVNFKELDPHTYGTTPVVGGTAGPITSLPLTAGDHYQFQATFHPATATAFASSTSTVATTPGFGPVTTRPTTGGTVRQAMKVTVKAGRLTLSCTRYATTGDNAQGHSDRTWGGDQELPAGHLHIGAAERRAADPDQEDEPGLRVDSTWDPDSWLGSHRCVRGDGADDKEELDDTDTHLRARTREHQCCVHRRGCLLRRDTCPRWDSDARADSAVGPVTAPLHLHTVGDNPQHGSANGGRRWHLRHHAGHLLGPGRDKRR